MPYCRVIPLLAVLSCAGVLHPATTFAQTAGVKGGLALSQGVFPSDFAETTALSPGWLGGGYGEVRLPWRLGVRVEVLATEMRISVNDVQRDTFRYLEVPILLRYRVGQFAEHYAAHVVGGVVTRRMLSATETVGDESFAIEDGVRHDDLALAVGGAVDITSRWSVDVRYLQGRKEIYRRFTGDFVGTLRTVQVTAEFGF